MYDVDTVERGEGNGKTFEEEQGDKHEDIKFCESAVVGDC